MIHVVLSDQHSLHATDDFPSAAYPFRLSELPARQAVIRDAIWDGLRATMTSASDHGLEPILAVHTPGYVDFLKSHRPLEDGSVLGGSRVFPHSFAVRAINRTPVHDLARMGFYSWDIWAPILPGTWTAAYWSAQCAVGAADTGAQQGLAYALCRPPGHHAGPDYCGGLCYLNNAAIAVRRLQSTASADCGRVAVLDIDYHHGNGTQHTFYADPAVLVCSLHVDPAADYPYYWGFDDEMGEGDGEGLNRNWPLPPETEGRQYCAALEEALAAIVAWGADVLVVSAGFDTADGDPLGNFRLSSADYRAIGASVAELALPTVVIQEGGYQLHRLGSDVVAFLWGLGGDG